MCALEEIMICVALAIYSKDDKSLEAVLERARQSQSDHEERKEVE